MAKKNQRNKPAGRRQQRQRPVTAAKPKPTVSDVEAADPTGPTGPTAAAGDVLQTEESMAALEPKSGGSPDKDAVAAVGPRIQVVTPEGADWLNRDPYGLKRAGLYGRRNSFALRYNDVERYAQFRGAPLGPDELETLHGEDTTAPEEVVECPICEETVSSFVRTAMVGETGDLVRDEAGNVQYRGQFVAVGPDATNLTVHGAHAGDCLYQLRIRRNRDGSPMRKTFRTKEGRDASRVVLLPCHSFDQANGQREGVRAAVEAKRAENKSRQDGVTKRLGFGGANAAGGNFTGRPRWAKGSGQSRGPSGNNPYGSKAGRQ